MWKQIGGWLKQTFHDQSDDVLLINCVEHGDEVDLQAHEATHASRNSARLPGISWPKGELSQEPSIQMNDRRLTRRIKMKTVLVAAAMLVGTMVSAQAANLSKADCEATWNDARPKGSDMDAALAKPYVTDFKAVDTNSDNHISSDEFYVGCDKGLVHAASPKAKETAPKN